ncbi:hypothetical protein [Clostridium sp. UBA1056]|uniref:hypothetical protein n=1 Tax=unclassified Clostridium TaxID=2614128 RepID=UPI003216881A
MSLEIHDYNRDSQSLHEECRKYMYCHVMLVMRDGTMMDGIIESVDPERVTMLMGEDVMEEDGEDQFGQQRQQFGRRRRRFRRFRRRHFPFRDLARLFLFFTPFPF